jgi:hypothetical protein
MAVQASADSRHGGRFVRFSMRALIGLVLLIGVGLGSVVRSAHLQRDTVAEIDKAGGSVTYDWKWRNGNEIRGAQP